MTVCLVVPAVHNLLIGKILGYISCGFNHWVKSVDTASNKVRVLRLSDTNKPIIIRCTGILTGRTVVTIRTVSCSELSTGCRTVLS